MYQASLDEGERLRSNSVGRALVPYHSPNVLMPSPSDNIRDPIDSQDPESAGLAIQPIILDLGQHRSLAYVV
jgi:hypothetical protein